MACDDCARRELAEILDGLECDVEELRRVKRNQGIALAVLIGAGLLVLARLNAKGVLSYAELLEGPASG
jgi:hypothetical protein